MDAGGFSKVLFFADEEQPLCYDLVAAGWECTYLPDVVAHHHPSARRRAPLPGAVEEQIRMLEDQQR